MDARELTTINNAKSIIVLAEVAIATLGSAMATEALAEARTMSDNLVGETDQEIRLGHDPETWSLINEARRAVGRAELAAWEAANPDLL